MINDIALAGVSGEGHDHDPHRSGEGVPCWPHHHGDPRERIERLHSRRRAFEQVTYEIESSRLKPGCAENAIVNGFVSLVEQRR